MSHSRTKAVRIAKRSPDDKYIAQASEIYMKAKDDFYAKRSDTALQKLLRVREILEGKLLFKQDYELLANCYYHLGKLYQQDGQLDMADTQLCRAVSICSKNGVICADKNPNIPLLLYVNAFRSLAELKYEKGDKEKAQQYADNLNLKLVAYSSSPVFDANSHALLKAEHASLSCLLANLAEPNLSDAIDYFLKACLYQEYSASHSHAPEALLILAKYKFKLAEKYAEKDNFVVAGSMFRDVMTVLSRHELQDDAAAAKLEAHCKLAAFYVEFKQVNGELDAAELQEVKQMIQGAYDAIPDAEKTELDCLAMVLVIKSAADLEFKLAVTNPRFDAKCLKEFQSTALHQYSSALKMLAARPNLSPLSLRAMEDIYSSCATVSENLAVQPLFDFSRNAFNEDGMIEKPLRRIFAFKHQGALMSGEDRLLFNYHLLLVFKLMHKIIAFTSIEDGDRFDELLSFFKDDHRVSIFVAELEERVSQSETLQERIIGSSNARSAFVARVQEAKDHLDHLKETVAEYQRSHPDVALPPALSMFAPQQPRAGGASASSPSENRRGPQRV